jgi:hypothetical protein
VEDEDPALLLAHASIELSPVTSAAAALLHLDEPRAHTLLGNGSSSDKNDGWCLNTDTTHHMTGRRELFTELDSDVRGSVKFGDASGVEIKDGVMRIWDRHHLLLAKVTRGTNRLYVLNVQVAQPLCLAARWDEEAWQWHERFGHLHIEALKQLSTKGMVRGLPSHDRVEQLCDVCVLTRQRRLPFPQQLSF